MNVAFIASELAANRGGIESVSYSLVKGFPDYVSLYAYYGRSKNGTENDSIPNVYYSDARKGICQHLDLIKKCFRDHRRFSFDFTFASHFALSLPCFLLKTFKGIPYGILVHGTELQDKNGCSSILGKLYFALKKRVRKAVIKSADVIFANSNFTKEVVEKKYGKYKKKIVVIHPPIQYVDKNVRAEENVRSHILLSLGRLEERKGFQYVIDAMKELIIDVPELKYYVAGAGAYLTALKERVEKHGLQDHVYFLGKVSEEEKDRLYRECDYFIMPSYMKKDTEDFEGFGIVYIEANTYGKYVIATRSGGIPDAVCEGVTGAFVEEQDPKSIYKLLKELYNDDFYPDRSKCIEWAKKMDANVIVKQYVDAISDVLN